MARRLLRHKTRKASFQRNFWTTVVGNVTLWLLVLWWWAHGGRP